MLLAHLQLALGDLLLLLLLLELLLLVLLLLLLLLAMLAILPEPVQARNGGHGGNVNDNDWLAALTGDTKKNAGTNEEANDASIGHLALAAA